MGNDKLAQAAIDGVLSASWAPLESGLCQVFARRSYEQVYGKEYEKYRRASAALTGLAFQAGGLAMTPQQAGEIKNGDILYKVHGSGGYGHVGINTDERGVAENSSTKIGRVRKALGFRTLAQFGSFDLVVRLPAIVEAKREDPKLILAIKGKDGLKYIHLEKSVLKDKQFTVDADEVAKALAADLNIRSLIDAFGWKVYDEGDHLSDAKDPRQYLFIQKGK